VVVVVVVVVDVDEGAAGELISGLLHTAPRPSPSACACSSSGGLSRRASDGGELTLSWFYYDLIAELRPVLQVHTSPSAARFDIEPCIVGRGLCPIVITLFTLF